MSLRRAAAARALAWAILPAMLTAAAGAQTTPAPATPAPAPAGFSARAHANLSVVAQGTTFAGAVELGVAQRAQQIRIDVLSVKSDAIPLPPISVTAVIDHRANTLTLWNDATRQYRVQPFVPRPGAAATPRASASPRASARPRSSASPPAAPRGSSPFAKLEVLEATLRLTGHTTTAGLPTTGFAFDLQVRNKGDQASSHVSASTQLADEFAIFPMTVELSLEPGMVPVAAKLSYAVDDLTRGLPPAARFTIPAGYTEARSILNVIFPGGLKSVPIPARSASPLPTASP